MSAKKINSPRSPGIGVFNHFPRQRFRPYGEIKEATPDDTMVEKANTINCEYLALSELADTVSSNKDILRTLLSSLDTQTIMTKVEQLDETVNMFNTRCETPVKSSDVHKLLKYSIADPSDNTDSTFDAMEHLGMIMYVIGSHQKQLRALVRNTADYSKKCQDLPAKHEFKLNPGLKSLKSWLSTESVTQLVKPTTISQTYRRNLLAELGSDTDTEDDTRGKKDKRGKGKGKKRMEKQPSVSSLSSDMSDDDIPPAPKPSSTKRKAQELELSDDDLADAGPSGESNWEPTSQREQQLYKDKTKSKKAKKKEEKLTFTHNTYTLQTFPSRIHIYCFRHNMFNSD